MSSVTRPALELRFRRVPGARYYAWPVYLDALKDCLCYEASGCYLVDLPEAEYSVIRFTDAYMTDGEEEQDLVDQVARLIGWEG